MTDTRERVERIERQVERLAEHTGIEWTFGYIGNCGPDYDDRSWYAFAAHPGRVGTNDDRIGGVPTEDLDKLALMLQGALALARVQGLREALQAISGPTDSGPWIEIYRAAGGGYEGLQAIARTALGENREGAQGD